MTAGKKIFKGMKCLYWGIAAVLSSSFFLPPHLLPKKIKFERITIEDGLSQNTVYNIFKDSRGFLWFGTDDGLNRFDGYTFKVYKHNPDDSSGPGANKIYAIYEDKSGVLWIGTDGGGLNRFNREKETFTCYMNDPADPASLSNNTVWAIYEDRSGSLWIGTRGGLNRFDREKETFARWQSQPGNPNSLSKDKIRTIHEDESGTLWIGTIGGGLNRFDRKEGLFSHCRPGAGSGKHKDIRAIYQDKAGGLRIGTEKGLKKYDRKKGVFTAPFTGGANSCGLSSGIIMSIYEDPVGVSWIGTYGGGLIRFDPGTKTCTRYKHKPGNPGSLSSNCIQCIYEDNGGILWVGTDSGLNKYDKKREKFGHCENEPGNPDSLCHNMVYALYKDRQGLPWIGTEDGLDCLDRETGKFTSPTHLRGRRINAICEDKTGALWIGTYGDSLYRLDRKNRAFKFKHYRHDPANPGSLCSSLIYAICESKNSELWVGTPWGLDKFDRQKEIFTHYINIPGQESSLSDNAVNTIYEDRSGVLWVGTKGGLDRFHRESGTFSHWKKEPGNPNSLSSNFVSSIWEDPSGILWIGTLGGGINKFHREKNTFTHYLEKHGLPNATIYAILGDEEGNLWVSTNKGISRFDPRRETARNYDARDGLQSNEFNSGAYCKGEDGEMFFGGINGFNAFYPGKLKDNPHIPPIVITDFRVLNRPVVIGEESPLKKAVSETGAIVLNYRDHEFSFDFAALDFSCPGKNRYAYKMEGFDRDWIYRDAKKRFAGYTNLDPGEYFFRVIGSNNDGVWNRKGAAIKIIIVPPYWKTWWFRLLVLVVFAVLSYVVINFIKNYIIMSGFWKREKYIGRYKLVEKIGAGGMSTVHKAYNTEDKSEIVAIKVLREELFEDENHRKRFKQEAAIIDQLDHPNIVKVFERGRHKQKLFFVMELLEGKTLAKKIREEPRIDFKEMLDILIQVTDAIRKMHKRNIVHRDLKPENIMLIEKQGNCNFVKLLDFGLARMQFQSRITQSGTVLGTINYMSPEQIADGELSLASDIYSMGVIFYETATSRAPFPGDRMTQVINLVMNRIPIAPIRLRPDIPVLFNQVTMGMLEKDSKFRPTIEEVTATLKKIKSHEIIHNPGHIPG